MGGDIKLMIVKLLRKDDTIIALISIYYFYLLQILVININHKIII